MRQLTHTRHTLVKNILSVGRALRGELVELSQHSAADDLSALLNTRDSCKLNIESTSLQHRGNIVAIDGTLGNGRSSARNARFTHGIRSASGRTHGEKTV